MFLYTVTYHYRGADKSLVRPGRKQATFPAFYGTWRFITTITRFHHQSLPQPNESIPLPVTLLTVAACFFPGRAKDLSTPRYNCLHVIILFYTNCSFGNKSVTTQIWHFLSYWYRKKRFADALLKQVQCHNAVCKTRRWRAAVSSLHSQEINSTSKTFKSLS